MDLNYRTFGQGNPLIILHGIFGTSDNWQTFGKALSEKYQVFLLDLRNHGNSPHSEEFTYTVMADDLKAFIEQHHLENPIILGHSMGGKVAMFFAASYPDLFEKMIVVDIGPKYYPPHHQKILTGLEAVEIDKIESRKEAEEQLSKHIKDVGVRQFLLKNLKRTNTDGFVWKLNLPVIHGKIENVGEALETDQPVEKPILFVRGAKSDYIQDEDKAEIRKIFPLAQVVTIKDAGHWVHAEQPEALYEAVIAFLE